MKSGIILVAMMLSAGAYAKDSTWKLCEGNTNISGSVTTTVLNMFEHRTEKGRATDLTLIYGGHVLSGSLDTTDTEAGKVELKGTSGSYEGDVNIDSGIDGVYLQGTLTLNGTKMSVVDANLYCKIIED